MPKIALLVSALALLSLPSAALAAQAPSCRSQCIKYCNHAPGGMTSTQGAKSRCMGNCLGNCQARAAKKS